MSQTGSAFVVLFVSWICSAGLGGSAMRLKAQMQNACFQVIGINILRSRMRRILARSLMATFIRSLLQISPRTTFCAEASLASHSASLGFLKKNSLGRKHGFDDEKQGNLFFSIADILDYHKPAAFVLENVKNLRSHDKGRTFAVIYDTLTRALGYQVYFKTIDAIGLVPQHRERIFLVGFKTPRHFEFPAFPIQGPKLASILEKDVPAKYTLTPNLWEYLQNYAKKHQAAGNGFGFGLVRADMTTRTLSARYHKDGSEILVSQGEGRIPRRLTPRECARLMGYPESHKIPVSDTQAYRQFGNSVVMPVVAKIAKEVVNTLSRPVDYRPDFVLTLGEQKTGIVLPIQDKKVKYTQRRKTKK